MVECHVSFLGHSDLDLSHSFKNYCIPSIFLILFEIEIPNLACGCILEWWSVVFHLRTSLILTSDLIFRIIVAGAYHLYYLFEVGIPNLV